MIPTPRDRARRRYAQGHRDTEIGIKYRFYERKADDTALMLGVCPMYQLATGARALGADRGTHGVSCRCGRNTTAAHGPSMDAGVTA